MGFSRQKARPSHPRRDAEAQERFKKGGFAIQLWFQPHVSPVVAHAPGTRQIGYRAASVYAAFVR